MGSLSSRFLRTMAAASSLALSAAATDADAGPAQKNPPVLHMSAKTRAALSSVTDHFTRLAGDMDHVIVIAPEDVIPPAERRRIEQFGGKDPQIEQFYAPGIAEQRINNFLANLSWSMPHGFVKFVDSRGGQEFARDSFRDLALDSPHALPRRDPTGNVCIVASSKLSSEDTKTVALNTKLDETLVSLPPIQDYGRKNYELLMLHEAAHCGQENIAKPVKGKLRRGMHFLHHEIDADDKAIAAFTARYGDNEETRQTIRYFEAVRAIGAVRLSSAGLSNREDFIDHANNLSHGGAKLSEADIMLGGKVLVTMKNSLAGLLSARPEILGGDKSLIGDYLKESKLGSAPLEKRLDRARRHPAMLGAFLTEKDPMLEYVAIEAIKQKLEKRTEDNNPTPGYERAVLRLARDYVSGMRIVAPAVAEHPATKQLTQMLPFMPEAMWEKPLDVLSLPQRIDKTQGLISEQLLGTFMAHRHPALHSFKP